MSILGPTELAQMAALSGVNLDVALAYAKISPTTWWRWTTGRIVAPRLSTQKRLHKAIATLALASAEAA